MLQAPTINRNPPKHQSQDFWLLRQRGIEYLQQLGGKIWTDHNDHDPGITILEVLCYAITEIGHRIQQPIPELLNRNPYLLTKREDLFFPPHMILPNCPLTPNDYRKLLIDLPGIRNAYLHPSPRSEQDFYCRSQETSNETLQPEYLTYQDSEIGGYQTEHILPKGLYLVRLEFEPRSWNDSIFRDENTENPWINTPVSEISLPYWFEMPDFDYWSEGSFEVQSTYLIETTSFPDNYYYDHSFLLEITLSDGTSTITSAIEAKTAGLIPYPNGEDLTDSFIHDSILAYKNRLVNIGQAVKLAKQRLVANRNLCEDFVAFTGIKHQEIAICGSIELSQKVHDPQSVLLKIFREIDQFLSPSIPKYKLQTLLDEGYALDEIFEGPLLANGYIKEADLQSRQRQNAVFTSDLINIIMDIEGVVAVHNFSISSYLDNALLAPSDTECISLIAQEILRPRLEARRSANCLQLHKQGYQIPKESYLANLLTAFEAYREQSVATPGMDLPSYPEVMEKADVDHYSIQHDFPTTYGIGTAGLRPSVPDSRKAQAKQLQGYLFFYDQLLANFLAQLTHLKHYFSMTKAEKQTYFFEPLYKVPGIRALLRSYTEYNGSWEEFILNTDDSNTYLTQLESSSEKRTTFVDRRNRFLDHLLARFAEDFTDYSLLLYNLQGANAHEELILDKPNFLQDLPIVSSCRAKAFNYRVLSKRFFNNTAPIGAWDTDNISGFERRVGRKLGFDTCRRRDLSWNLQEAAFFEIDENTGAFILKNEALDPILIGQPGAIDIDADLRNEKIRILRLAQDPEQYEIVPAGPQFNIVLKAGADPDSLLAESPLSFDAADEASDGVETLTEYIINHASGEGLHLLEHILLRPRHTGQSPGANDRLLPIPNLYPWGDKPGLLLKDPYSFVVTIVLPSGYRKNFGEPAPEAVAIEGAERMRNPEFRQFAEQLIRTELPVHIYAEICWLDVDTDDSILAAQHRFSLNNFELRYRKWLEVFMATNSPTGQLVASQRFLTHIMMQCPDCCLNHIPPPDPEWIYPQQEGPPEGPDPVDPIYD